MLDLDEVTSKVPRMELSADTRQRHLARLHAVQAGRTGARRTRLAAGMSAGPTRSTAAWSGGLAAAAVAVVAGASALLTPAYHPPAATAGAGAGSNTASATASTSAPTDRRSAAVTSTGSDVAGLTDAQFSTQLAGILGLSVERASTVTAWLTTLGGRGVEPTSAQFAQVAAVAGVTPARLAAAIDQIKKTQAAISASTGPGQPKNGDITPAGTPLTAATQVGAPAKSTAQNTAQNLLTTNRSVDLLASALGLSRPRAAELAGKLAVLDHGAGLDPRSSSFQGIAHDFGRTADQLAAAIEQIKKGGT